MIAVQSEMLESESEFRDYRTNPPSMQGLAKTKPKDAVTEENARTPGDCSKRRPLNAASVGTRD